MKRKMHYVASILTVAAFVAAAADDSEKLKTEATQTIAAFKNADSGLASFFDASAGCAVFPNIGKGGLIVGGLTARASCMRKTTSSARRA